MSSDSSEDVTLNAGLDGSADGAEITLLSASPKFSLPVRSWIEELSLTICLLYALARPLLASTSSSGNRSLGSRVKVSGQREVERVPAPLSIGSGMMPFAMDSERLFGT